MLTCPSACRWRSEVIVNGVDSTPCVQTAVLTFSSRRTACYFYGRHTGKYRTARGYLFQVSRYQDLVSWRSSVGSVSGQRLRRCPDTEPSLDRRHSDTWSDGKIKAWLLSAVFTAVIMAAVVIWTQVALVSDWATGGQSATGPGRVALRTTSVCCFLSPCSARTRVIYFGRFV